MRLIQPMMGLIMDNDTLLSIIQVLQLLGLGPCLLLMCFLMLTMKQPRRAVVPFLFLLCLSAGFLGSIEHLMGMPGSSWALWRSMMEGAFPALAFLLMIQFLEERVPRPTYWLVLLLPIMGSLAFWYVATLSGGEICFGSQKTVMRCIDHRKVLSLYHVVTGGLILLLLMPELAFSQTLSRGDDRYQQDRFWLIIGVIVLTVTLLGAELVSLTEAFANQEQLLLIRTVVRLLFIFVMFASLFRVFAGQFALAMERIPTAKRLMTDRHTELAQELTRLLESEKRYREMGLSRGELADALGTGESNLSYVVNRCFDCNLNGLINRYRIQEAKERLVNEPETPVTTIAFEVGFNSIPSFNRVFKEMTGMPPSKWRENGE